MLLGFLGLCRISFRVRQSDVLESSPDRKCVEVLREIQGRLSPRTSSPPEHRLSSLKREREIVDLFFEKKMSVLRNPSSWRYTWETLAHIPNLRLFLFNPVIKPATQCHNLTVTLKFEESLLLVSWNEQVEDCVDGIVDFVLRVPVPRVLIELGSPLDFKMTEDHIEVKLVLLLPIDHPLVLNFDSVLNLSEDDDEDSSSRKTDCSDHFQPLSIGSDIKHLLSSDGIQFYCNNCSSKLTKKPLRSFVEMPSVDWREVADNWFGTCCCSFGGISEKLVTKYVRSHTCAEGTCLYDATSVIVSKDDLAGYVFLDLFDGSKLVESEPDLVSEDYVSEAMIVSDSSCGGNLCCGPQNEKTSDADDDSSSMPPKIGKIDANVEPEVIEELKHVDTSCISPPISEFSGDVVDVHGLCAKDSSLCCVDKTNYAPSHVHKGFSDGLSIKSSLDQNSATSKLMRDHKSLYSGYLGSGFMVRTANLSKDVEWIEFRCTQCSYILGAYPSSCDRHAPIDGGVRFFKCYISSDLPVGGSGDIFRKHSLQRMFANKLVESANDELSFRTVVKDLRTNCPMLQIVLLNSNAWSCTGHCLESEGIEGTISKVDLHPVVKVLFSDGSNATTVQSRMIEDWAIKNHAGEVYMLTHQIKELIEALIAAQDRFPFSCSFMEGFTLSSLER